MEHTEREQNSCTEMERYVQEHSGHAEIEHTVWEQNGLAEIEHTLWEQTQDGDLPPGCTQEQEEAVYEFELTIRAPERFELRGCRGWQGAADAPEEPDTIKSNSLCLLASQGGSFLPVTTQAETLMEGGVRTVQVCVSLPADFSSPKALTLELWAVGNLVCSYSAMLLSPDSTAGAAALTEQQGWAAGQAGTPPEGSGPFMRDLVRWMRFQAYCAQQQQEQQQQQQPGLSATEGAGLPDALMQQQRQQPGLSATKDVDLSDASMLQQLEPMKSVGMNLLAYILEQGMEGAAGLLLECLCSFPFCIPPLALLHTLTNVDPEGDEGAHGDQGATPASTLHGGTHSPRDNASPLDNASPVDSAAGDNASHMDNALPLALGDNASTLGNASPVDSASPVDNASTLDNASPVDSAIPLALGDDASTLDNASHTDNAVPLALGDNASACTSRGHACAGHSCNQANGNPASCTHPAAFPPCTPSAVASTPAPSSALSHATAPPLAVALSKGSGSFYWAFLSGHCARLAQTVCPSSW
ncbi:hypothetical protein DUNSADRAFT_11501 [Dunaliella salina]|uniref:Uncharacterized protein n=1 Tax=Dunaliella salina TaxID=3046 RepID=A0ABQ7GD91_DUNSA|nr:hypothetical protein DUNSADRAFT_11501 [Dunaliella salina]|eukprot:KAF5832571.1 hypothetical protein DUNSADRAFT_11501 [Dunaliella salina]